jgi:hypothetical protein
MRPQGFTGRTFAAAHPDLKLSANPMVWTDDEVLWRCMATTCPATWWWVKRAFERLHTLGSAGPGRVSDDYPLLADHAMQGSLPGSSAGGEQPSFAFVWPAGMSSKFSPAGDGPVWTSGTCCV